MSKGSNLAEGLYKECKTSFGREMHMKWPCQEVTVTFDGNGEETDPILRDLEHK